MNKEGWPTREKGRNQRDLRHLEQEQFEWLLKLGASTAAGQLE